MRKDIHNGIKYIHILQITDVIIRAVDAESQNFKTNLKFTFHAVKQQILRIFRPNSARILFLVIIIHFISYMRRFLKKRSLFLYFISFVKYVWHDLFVAIFSTAIHKSNTKSHVFGFKKDIFQLLNPGITGNTYFRRYLINKVCMSWVVTTPHRRPRIKYVKPNTHIICHKLKVCVF